jgi:channel protein (hemolysin III family)
MEKDYIKLPKNIDDKLIKSLINNFNVFKYNFTHIKSDINKIYHSSFIALNDTYTQIVSNIDSISNNFHNFFHSFSIKFNNLGEKLLDLMEFENIYLGRKIDNNLDEKRRIKNLKRWPLFVFIISAILCLSFSSIFHLIGNISIPFHRVLSRFDYGGVCLLITGSVYPPIYYFFYYETRYRLFYLTFITAFGLTIFGLCLTNGFNLPSKRVLRGSLFLTFGLSTGIPFIHILLSADNLKGYNENARYYFWYLGGITYIIGAVLYIIRFPEKLYPGRFDIFGTSHQLLHIAVLIAAYFHYIGSLDAYYSRFDVLY